MSTKNLNILDTNWEKSMQNINLDEGHISNKLIAYLRDELKNPDIEYQAPLEQLRGGYQTSIYRFQLKGVDDELSQPLVLRLYPQFYGPGDAQWESIIQNALAKVGYPVAKVHFVCTDMSVLGGAFLVMDHIPGQPLMFAPQETVPATLGKIHADLHKIHPEHLISAINAQGIDPGAYSLDSQFEWLENMPGEYEWARKCAKWLIDNRPPQPESLSICHGDFHALNIMVQDREVTGVLDWSGMRITDPVYDVANTIVLITIPIKYLVGSREEFSKIDWDLAAELYLSAYQAHKELDVTILDYYKVRRCLQSLIEGFEGQEVWQHPMIIGELISTIKEITKLQITMPEVANNGE